MFKFLRIPNEQQKAEISTTFFNTRILLRLHTGNILSKLKSGILCTFGCNLKLKPTIWKCYILRRMIHPFFPLRLKLPVVERMLNIPGNLCLFGLHILIKEAVHHSTFPCTLNLCNWTGSIYFNAALSNALPSKMANSSNTITKYNMSTALLSLGSWCGKLCI